MKTATITWISYNNYGTLLQAYALQKQLKFLGHENVILNDNQILKEFSAAKRKSASPAKHTLPACRESGIERIRRILSDPGAMPRRILSRLDLVRYGLPYEDSQKTCSAFRRTELNVLDISPSDLSSLRNSFDAFLCGSDQIWSVFENIFNTYYFLDFAEGKKIAYAPCLGTDKIPDHIANEMQSLLLDFSAISVREQVSAQQLSDITGRNVAWVCDPTLLHDRDFWMDFTKVIPSRKGKYLLCYFLESRPWYFDRANALAKQLGLKLKLIPSRWEHLRSQYVIADAIGPREFVSLFRDAEYVLTDSYHGSIFSVIFEKDFQYLLRFAPDDPKSQNIRIQSLFGRLGLNDRIIQQGIGEPLDSVNYETVGEKLLLFRQESLDYLKHSLTWEDLV